LSCIYFRRRKQKWSDGLQPAAEAAGVSHGRMKGDVTTDSGGTRQVEIPMIGSAVTGLLIPIWEEESLKRTGSGTAK